MDKRRRQGVPFDHERSGLGCRSLPQLPDDEAYRGPDRSAYQHGHISDVSFDSVVAVYLQQNVPIGDAAFGRRTIGIGDTNDPAAPVLRDVHPYAIREVFPKLLELIELSA